MTVLRSRVVQAQPSRKTLKERVMEPATPVKALEISNHQSPSTPTSTPFSQTLDPKVLSPNSVSSSGAIRRRSLRLASKSNSPIIEDVSIPNRRRISVSAENRIDLNTEFDVCNVEVEDRVLDSEVKKIRVSDQDGEAIRVSGDLDVQSKMESGSRNLGDSGSAERKGKRKLGLNVDSLVSEIEGEDERDLGFLSLRSGTKILKRSVQEINGGDGGAVVVVVSDDDDENERESERGSGNFEIRRKSSRGEKGKGRLANEDNVSNVVETIDLDLDLNLNLKISGGDRVSETNVAMEELKLLNDDGSGTSSRSRRRHSREEKGKEKVVEVEDGVDVVNLDLTLETRNRPGVVISSPVSSEEEVEVKVRLKDEEDVLKMLAEKDRKYRRRLRQERIERSRQVARDNASRFAHFSFHEGEENHGTDEAEGEMPARELEREVEDWPGPFSTAMKIIRDRESNANVGKKNPSLEKSNSPPLIWSRREGHQRERVKPLVPSLQELCMTILAKNADAITSLDCVPDALRHKLSHLLCDSRRMNSHFLDLLVCGSPTEVRVRDCSWLTEEQFERNFETCDTKYLTVLQLDQCGRCMPDYILSVTLVRSPNSLPALTTISLRGACRLSDAGLSALVSSAPALKSVNLGQCSLLTSSGINILPGSLRELYLDDCQNIDPMHVLPALKKLEHLQVLSLAGIQSVCDDFIREFVVARGLNMKEIILADCVKLTDSALKVIAETCSGLCALDLVNLCKLTDSSLGYLANGCQGIRSLKLCRNAFSDEAVAAFLETSGEFLNELSLNNVNKVGQNTAISLARCSKQLVSLDLSWCRSMTDEAVGLIVDSCLSLKLLKLFGCTQITEVFVNGHSNPQVQIVGLKMTPLLKHLNDPDSLQGPLRYPSVSSI